MVQSLPKRLWMVIESPKKSGRSGPLELRLESPSGQEKEDEEIYRTGKGFMRINRFLDPKTLC